MVLMKDPVRAEEVKAAMAEALGFGTNRVFH